MKTSIASLQERLAGWTDWDLASHHLGACLGFWPEFGAPPGHDHWQGTKGVIWSSNALGDALHHFLNELVNEGCLERREDPDTAYRWNPNYKGSADIISVL
jgi:hypothetical protein